MRRPRTRQHWHETRAVCLISELAISRVSHTIRLFTSNARICTLTNTITLAKESSNNKYLGFNSQDGRYSLLFLQHLLYDDD